MAQRPRPHADLHDPDRAVAALAARQDRVVTTAQLAACGLSGDQVTHRLRRAALHRLHHGTYLVGPPLLSDRVRWRAAVLATDGVLSHGSAAALWGVWADARPVEHVTVLRGRGAPQAGLAVHRVRALDRRDVTVHGGLPVTTPARTLLDLAAVLPPRRLDVVLREARARRLAPDAALRDVLARHPRRAGGPRLAAALLGPFTRSHLERCFRALLAEHGLPEPRWNARVEGLEADAWWPAAALVVELDGRATHGVTAAIARDAARDARLRALGLHVERLTWWDVRNDGARTAARIRGLLDDVAHRPRP